MKLFNKFQSRSFQFALDLIVSLKQFGKLSIDEIDSLVRQYGLDYADQILSPLLSVGIITRVHNVYRLSGKIGVPFLPISNIEKEYLQYILRLPAAALFLDGQTLAQLTDSSPPPRSLQSIQRYESVGAPLPDSPEIFRALLKAVREKLLIKNLYSVRGNDNIQESIVLPWKLEYDSLDHRWWVILYHPTEKRMIKARLNNFKNIEILRPANIPNEELNAAMDNLLETNPIVIRVNNVRGALERCFLVFESQLFEETRKVSDDCYELVFRYYRFDRSEILRKLLYLGSPVTLVEPQSLRNELLDLVTLALQNCHCP